MRNWLVLAATVCLIAGLFATALSASFSWRAVQAQGVILEMVANGETTAPKFTFQDETGITHVITSETGSDLWRVKVGDTIKVLYIPDNPKNAKIGTVIGVWLLPLVLFGLAVVLIWAAVRPRSFLF